MAYSITKPNIYFSGDKRILTETVASGISKFNVVMTHAKDSMYYVINDSTKDTIEIAIEPFKTDTNCVLTNYIMFPNDFSDKTISFIAPDGYEIYYTGDYTRAKYTENTIIAIQHVDMGKIVVTINAGEKTEKYGVLLTLETTTANETVHYHETDSSIDSIKFYWDYESDDNLGKLVHENYHTYIEPGEHKLLVLSDTDIQFPQHITNREINDISQHLTQIDKYKEYKPLLIKKEKSKWCYFAYFEKLRKINTNEIFDQNITTFNHCFLNCTSLIEIPTTLFYNNKQATIFASCFHSCKGIIEIPATLFYNNEQATNFTHCFAYCAKLKEIPPLLFAKVENTNTADFNNCFRNCDDITGDVPDLWNTHSSADGGDCFIGCENANNWEDIPYSWGGPKT